jgi:hypothetical protein
MSRNTTDLDRLEDDLLSRIFKIGRISLYSLAAVAIFLLLALAVGIVLFGVINLWIDITTSFTNSL